MGGPSSFPVTIICRPFPPPCLEGQSLGVVFQQPADFLRQDNNVTPSGPVLGVGAGSRGLVRAAGSRRERTRKDSSPCLLVQFSARPSQASPPPGSLSCSYSPSSTKCPGLPVCPVLLSTAASSLSAFPPIFLAAFRPPSVCWEHLEGRVCVVFPLCSEYWHEVHSRCLVNVNEQMSG